MKTHIPYAKPSITVIEESYVSNAMRTGWGENFYEYVARFEEEFKNHLNVQYAIATSSCTGALHLGMAALGIGHGDEVILADTNWIATAAPIVHLGAKPVFVDILPDSWCIDTHAALRAVTSHTKAIIATHLYGNLCEMGSLLTLGNNLNIPIIEDAAEAIGSVYHHHRAGSMGKFGVFSFHGSKTITTGEGGMFVTNDPSLYESALTISNHGRERKQVKQFWPTQIGLKYKMTSLQAAVGCAQLTRLDDLVKRKREILIYYHDKLEKWPLVIMNPEPVGTINGAWMPTVVFHQDTKVIREQLQAAFKDENIDARVFFWPLSSLHFFEDQPQNKYAWDIPNRAINLPSYHDMTYIEQDRVIEVVKRCLENAA